MSAPSPKPSTPSTPWPARCDRYRNQREKAGDAIRGPGMVDAAVDLGDQTDTSRPLTVIAGRDPG